MAAEGRRDFGLVVDAVSDVSDVQENEVRETPAGAGGGDNVPKLATLGEQMVLLLDIDGMFAGGEQVAMAA